RPDAGFIPKPHEKHEITEGAKKLILFRLFRMFVSFVAYRKTVRIRLMRNWRVTIVATMLALAAAGCARPAPSPLIAASTTMVTAWQIPQNPLTDPALTDPKLSEQIKWGYRIFVD